ncbi:MAG: histidine kinase dimerization/phospho-acceptor domain-containing protein, partial [Perlucidibaca sp.]
IEYRQDLESQFAWVGRTTLEASASALSERPRDETGADLQAFLARQLRHDSLRRLTLTDRGGHVIADAGGSTQPLPDLGHLDIPPHRAVPAVLTLDHGDTRQWLAWLPGERWLVLTGSREPQLVAFYERLTERGLILLVGLAMMTLLVRLQVRHSLRPLSQLGNAMRQLPPGSRPAPGEAAREIWPEFVDHVERGLQGWQAAFDEARSSSERAEEELRETLETIERQNISLHAARREAVASNQLKSEFLANISHEIRTPLSSMIGFARLLERTPLSDRQREYVASMVHASEHLLAILNDLLDLSKIEAGRLVLDETPVALHELASDTVAMLTPLIGDKPVTLTCHVDPGVPRSLLGDPLRLRQIMTNLVNNAIKFTPRGEVRVHLQARRMDQASASLELTVSDTGIGIQPHLLENLFTAFE